MSIQELKTQSTDELKKTLDEKRDALRVMSFKVAQRQLKKVHEVKKTKREIARVLTFSNQLKSNKQEVK